MKMKAFFCSLKGETEQKESLLAELQGGSYHDLEIVKAFFGRIENSFLKGGSKGIPIYDKETKEYQFFKHID